MTKLLTTFALLALTAGPALADVYSTPSTGYRGYGAAPTYQPAPTYQGYPGPAYPGGPVYAPLGQSYAYPMDGCTALAVLVGGSC
jgi:hypothetical protein